MGARVTGLLERAIATKVTDDQPREKIVSAIAKQAGLKTGDLQRLLEGATDDAGDRDGLGGLAEAAGVEVDHLINAAVADGMLIEGEEVALVPLLEAAPFRIVESLGAADDGDRLYKAVVIRPCDGQGPGKRIYEAAVLKRDAAAFAPQPIYFNHEDLATIVKRGHGSRDPRDLAGYVLESWFDADYTEPDDAKNGYDQGAVLGKIKLREAAADLVDELPEAVKLSINMDPTRLRARRRRDGKMGTLVEGIVPQSGSVDLITGKAGAGGKILERLRESADRLYGPGHVHPSPDDLTDAQLLEAVRARPDVAAQLTEEPVSGITAEQLVEAIQSEDGAAAITKALEPLVEARVAEREDEIRNDAKAESRRELQLRDLRDEAGRLIEASKLPPTWQEDLRARYQLRGDGSPSAALNIHDDVDDSGNVTKTALDKLKEAVAADIERERNKLAEAAPTRVRGMGAHAGEAELDENGQPKNTPPTDPMADELGLDAEAVAKYRNSGGRATGR